MFILSYLSSGLEFWSVNHTSISEKSWSKLYQNITFLGEIANNWSNDLLIINVYKNIEPCW